MDVASILSSSRVRSFPNARSKKHALELLSEALSEGLTDVDTEDVLDGLIERERLGCTGLGRAVAMPHTRIAGIEESVGAFIRLGDPIDFDAADGEPVDLIFGLLVPENCDESQLSEVGELIEKLRDRGLQEQLHNAQDPVDLYNLLTESLTILHRTLTL